jgi:hypothetical protein
MHQCPSARPKQDADDEEGEFAIHSGKVRARQTYLEDAL